jgi:tRNA threonylcarbamoyladenosine biosynthesis protein TsaE
MVRTLQIKTTCHEETIRLGRAVGRVLEPGDVVLLIGDLGTGKTMLAKGIVSAATGVDQDEVVSPSFTLINRFEGGFPVHHADLYRIEGDQIQGIGLEDALDEYGALVVEWAEKLPDLDGEPLTIFLQYADEERCRTIVLQWPEQGSWNQRILSVLEKLDACPDLVVAVSRL